MRIIKQSEPILYLEYADDNEFSEIDSILEEAGYVYLGYFEGAEYWISANTYIVAKQVDED